MVEALEVTQLCLLLSGCSERIFEELEFRVLHQGVRVAGRAEGDALVYGRQEGGAEVVDASVEARRADRDEARQVLVLGTQSVAHPAPHARTQQGVAACEELHAGAAVRYVLVAEAVEHAELVGDLRQVLPELAHRDPALAGRAELPGRGEQVAACGELHPGALEGRRFAVVFLELRFRVEEVDVRRAAMHEEEDDPLGSRFEMRFPGSQGMERNVATGFTLGLEKVGEGESSESQAPGAQQIPAAQEVLAGL